MQMRTSDPGISSTGHTLIELVVVLAIIGIAAGAVSLSMSSIDGRRVDNEVDRLGALFRLAQDEARATGRTITWQADTGGYRFTANGRDRPDAADDPLRPRAWPFEVVSIDAPVLRFGLEPLLEPAQIRIDTPSRHLRLALDALGSLSIQP